MRFFHPVWSTVTAGYLALVYLMTLLPSAYMPVGAPGGWDKVAHFLMYAGLTGLCLLTVRRPLTFLRWGLLAVGLLVIAALNEWMQTFVGRHACLLDFVANVLGIATVFAIYLLRAVVSRKKSN